MLTKEPGWYPDPQGLPQVRLWDGDDWTDYTQPFAPLEEVAHGPTTALDDYPYLADADLRATQGPRTVSTWTPAPVLATPGATGPRRSGGGLVWWLVGAGVVVIAIIAVAANALIDGGSSNADPGGGADPVPSSTSTLPPFAPADAPTGTVPADGALTTVLEITTDGDYFVGATGDEDVEMTITPSGTTEPLALPDDRGNALAALVGGTWSDPGYWLTLPAGSYDVVLTERDGLETTAALVAEPATVVEVVPGTPVDVELTDDAGIAVLKLTTDVEAGAVVDVRGASEELDGQLTYLTGTRVTSIDDRGQTVAETIGGSEYDPYVELDLAPGSTFVVLEELYLSTATFNVSVTQG
ncbi:DUF2510 domain-containing protein [Serinibacter arcticus]|uniref:Flagelliform silk protein n=1 Tax=Serinibacter arcticus TaxID=1655435 RepID=A0A4Z1DXD1_9MICO|nr:DUF2510 domain-containing protein [Serinibacter arcticus]TGO04244.1 Flagelliform silk protein [Serinibacter arcticus]